MVVTKSYQRTYPDPIGLRAGESFRLTGKADDWQGNRWLWGVAADGREGWVPESLIVRLSQDMATVISDYSAQEANVGAGERVEIVRRLGGWSWVRSQSGEEGWVPDDCFTSLA